MAKTPLIYTHIGNRTTIASGVVRQRRRYTRAVARVLAQNRSAVIICQTIPDLICSRLCG